MSEPQNLKPTDADYKAAFDRIERRIEDLYEIPVRISDVLDPNTGDFDGTQIEVDYDQSLQSALFVLVHLFGHTVQWNISEDYRVIGSDLATGKDDGWLAQLFVYERAATQYSIQLMHDAGVTSLDRWLTDLWYADWEYLKHYYKTGEKLDIPSLVKPGKAEMLAPLPIPAFTPQKWISRWSF